MRNLVEVSLQVSQSVLQIWTSVSWLDKSEKQMKETLKDKMLEIVPAKCDS